VIGGGREALGAIEKKHQRGAGEESGKGGLKREPVDPDNRSPHNLNIFHGLLPQASTSILRTASRYKASIRTWRLSVIDCCETPKARRVRGFPTGV
jgi:hypothetical protein